MKLKAIFITTLFFSVSSATFAGTCEIHYLRTACPGKEEISYKKCKGKKECTKKKRAESIDECRKNALKSCGNSRLDITESKVITAKFDGAVVKTEDGKENFCAADRPDFNKCNVQ
ncbi:MAG: hypothetical protein H6618_03195 [Deltaproteobacteria bacterium]|nr:hypothetical protein [Deltaproteobacteria bacterium]